MKDMKQGAWIQCPGHYGVPCAARGKRGKLVRRVQYDVWVVYIPGVNESQFVDFE
jgi:hypothetical protein